jgi:KaiC/GvpD/RAD55 family RecA-like ATPase
LIEELIFSQLLTNDAYARVVLPHLKDEYFSSQEEKTFFKIYSRFFQKHNTIPSKQAMLIEIENLKSSADVYTSMKEMVGRTVEFEETLKYLVDTTEAFVKERAIFNALKESVLIVDGQSKTKTAEAIPSILQEALGVCFDTSVGHSYFEEAEARYDYYHLAESRIPTQIKIFDKITKNGFPRKTLNCLMSPPHGGKSLMLVNFGVGALMSGHNVLYITMEMAAEEIGRRFDVNLLGIDFDMLESLPKSIFTSKFNKISESSRGKLVIKEFPTGAANAGHFRALLAELKTKQNFIPDMIIVDYMSICSSEIYKNVGTQNSYTVVGSIGKELRALAIEADAALLTAIQTNRAGVGNSDVDMSNTSESMGVPAIADWFAAIIATDELKSLNQIMVKQIKNRYAGLSSDERFLLGVDYLRQKLFDIDGDSTVPTFTKKDKPLNNKVDTNAPFNFDMLHTIKPETSSFNDFNF